MKTDHKTYFKLEIVAKSPGKDIWLGDSEGYFIRKETGTLSTGLLPGKYVVEFGLGTAQYEFELFTDSQFTEAELTANESIPRRVPKFDEY